MGKRFYGEEEKAKARSANILSYLQACGEQFYEVSNGTYQHVEHDSLRYNARKNVLNWFSRSEYKACFNCIDAAQMMYGYSFTQAMHDILSKNISVEGIQQTIFFSAKNFDYERDVKEVESSMRVFNYLTKERQLNEKLIEYCFSQGIIAGDKLGNVVFKWADMWKENHQGLVGASLRGTREIPLEKRVKPENKYFRKILAGSQSDAGFFVDIGIPKKLIVGESAIDILSYASRKIADGRQKDIKDCRLVSMEGLKEKVVFRHYIAINRILATHDIRSPVQIMTVVDNDQPGQDFEHKLITKTEQFEIKGKPFSHYIKNEHIPFKNGKDGEKMKDQNDYLKFRLHQIEQRKLRQTDQDVSQENSQKQTTERVLVRR